MYGPRLTGSPNLKAAGEWVVKQLTSWGLKNAHLEPWDFGSPGWANERFTAHITSPVKDALVAEVLAWTPSTNGVARGQAVQIVLPVRPTQTGLATISSRQVQRQGQDGPRRIASEVAVTFIRSAPARDADVVTLLNTPPAQPPARQSPHRGRRPRHPRRAP